MDRMLNLTLSEIQETESLSVAVWFQGAKWTKIPVHFFIEPKGKKKTKDDAVEKRHGPQMLVLVERPGGKLKLETWSSG